MRWRAVRGGRSRSVGHGPGVVPVNRGVVALILVVAAAALVQAEHVSNDATTVRESECYSCHFEGGAGFGPPLTDMFRINPDPVELTVGTPGEFSVTVRNWWTAELREIEGRLDLSEAPALSFGDAPEPILDQSVRGTLPFVVGDVAQPERSARVTFEVPLGGTDLAIRLVPDRGTGDQAPDLELRIWGPADDTRDDPAFTINSQGAGATETLIVSGDPVPSGQWTVEVAEQGFLQTLSQSALASQPFTVQWDLRFDYEDPIRFTGSSDILDGQEQETPQTTQLFWPIQLTEPLQSTQTIHVEVVALSFYDHPQQFNAEDEWYIVHERTIQLTPPPVDDGETNETVTIGDDAPVDEGPQLTDDSNPASVWGEIIGYFAAFLLVVSLVSGGTFGHWSRRLQQWVLFRKAKRRVAFHNVVSYLLILASVVHLVVFLVETRFPWSLGLLLGGASLLGMAGAGFTGAFQKPMVRAMGFEAWRWLHWLSFAIAMLGAVAHMVLDGIHFTEFQDKVGWSDPLIEWLNG